jgi:LuxR family transcriptional regulator, maltose regulon positive regulatory protein
LLRSVAVLFGKHSGRTPLGITHQQLNILRLIAEGQENKEIARALGLTPKTVASYLELLFDKFEVRNRMELVRKAQERGLLELIT